jgi:uncharacterized protein YjbI with pentapeptide repeats/transcriptional regulator with XRE-family HTH domain
MIIGARISGARKNRGLSQTQLAAELNVSPQAVGKWERGESMPDIITFDRMAHILAVDLNYFSEDYAVGSFQHSQGRTDGRLQDGPQDDLQDDPRHGSPHRDGCESPDGQTEDMATAVAADFQNLIDPADPVGNKQPGFNMSGWSWKDADFSGLSGIGGKFSGSDIQRCLFTGADLSKIKLKGNTVINNNFNGCDFSTSLISGSTLKKCLFIGSNLTDAKISGSQVSDCDFSDADFSGAIIKGSSFLRNSLDGARWRNTAFLATRFTETVFSGEITGCSFENCSFSKTSFQDARFSNTFFKNRSLRKVGFLNCRADSITLAFLKNSGVDTSSIGPLP